MAAFEYRQAEELHEAFERHGVQYLHFGNSGAALHGFPDVSQAIEVFPAIPVRDGAALVAALTDLGFQLSPQNSAGIERGKDFVQLKNGPFDLDLIFTPDGIERFSDAWERHVEVDGYPVCHLDDIIASKKASNRAKDRESLPRLIAFRDYWLRKRR